MNCYLCYQDIGYATHPALGICQMCGAGVCERHLVPVTSHTVIGMAGRSSSGRVLYCSHCLEEIGKARSSLNRGALPKEPGTQKTTSWWRRWTWQRPRPLPEPKEAVAIVEHFLRQH